MLKKILIKLKNSNSNYNKFPIRKMYNRKLYFIPSIQKVYLHAQKNYQFQNFIKIIEND